MTAAEVSSAATTALRPFRSPLLVGLPGVAHGFTGRAVGYDAADANVGYSAPRDRTLAWAARDAWSAAIGLDAERMVTVGQVHGADVLGVGDREAGVGARPGTGPAGYADALVTDRPGVVLMTLHADCLPILLVDPDRPAVAAVHAGWRGTVAGVAGAAVAAMTRAFGTDPGRLLAAVGPAICAPCYEVGPEVVDAWTAVEGDPAAVVAGTGPAARPHFDLTTANRWSLVRAGLRPDRIDLAGICTRCDGEAWFSHRGQGPTTGRFGAVIGLTGDRPAGEGR